MASRRSGYSKMYMVPPSIWELVKKCVDEFERKRLEQLNLEKALVPVRTPGDQVLSTISARDITPLDRSYRSRSDILESTLDQPSMQLDVEDELFQDPSFHSIDRSRSRLDPDSTIQSIHYSDMTTQTVDPTEEPLDLSMRTDLQPLPSSSVQRSNIQASRIPILKKSIFKPTKSKRPRPVPVNEPITREMYTPVRTRTQPDPFRYGRLSPPIPGVISRDDSFWNRSSQSLNRSDINFDPLITSTPMPVQRRKRLLSSSEQEPDFRRRRMPTIHEQEPEELIPIQVLPLAGCEQRPQGIQTRSKTRGKFQEVSLEDEFKCTMCNKKFSKQIYLTKHMEGVHKVNVVKTFDRWR